MSTLHLTGGGGCVSLLGLIRASRKGLFALFSASRNGLVCLYSASHNGLVCTLFKCVTQWACVP